jgi:hypothetical protein
VHPNFTQMADPPLHALPLPQQQPEGPLEERAAEFGVDMHRGHQVTGASQDDPGVRLDVRAPTGRTR